MANAGENNLDAVGIAPLVLRYWNLMRRRRYRRKRRLFASGAVVLQPKVVSKGTAKAAGRIVMKRHRLNATIVCPAMLPRCRMLGRRDVATLTISAGNAMSRGEGRLQCLLAALLVLGMICVMCGNADNADDPTVAPRNDSPKCSQKE